MQTPLGYRGALNGVTPVEVLAAPPTGSARIVPANGISVCNCDSAAKDIIFQVLKGATTYIFWKELAVAAGSHVVLPKKVTLMEDDESFEVVMGSAITTVAPTWDISALEYTP